MEAFPPGAWEVARPSVILWVTEFGTAPPSRNINSLRDRLFTLGRRYDLLCRPTMYEDEVSDADAQGEDVHASVSDEPAAVPIKKSTRDKKKKAPEPSSEQPKEPEPPTVPNEITVSFVRLARGFCTNPFNLLSVPLVLAVDLPASDMKTSRRAPVADVARLLSAVVPF